MCCFSPWECFLSFPVHTYASWYLPELEMCHKLSPHGPSSSSEITHPELSVLEITVDSAKEHCSNKKVPSQLRALWKEETEPMNQGAVNVCGD